MTLMHMLNSSINGLSAAQAGIKAAADNVANVNTKSYARVETKQVSVKGGVEVAGVERIVNAYLRNASLEAASSSASAGAISDLLGQLQKQFGGTGDEGSIFGRLRQAFDSIAATAKEGAGASARSTAVSDIQSFFDEAIRLTKQVDRLETNADNQIQTNLAKINGLISQIADINNSYRAALASDNDSSPIANKRAALIDELSSYIDINLDQQSDGRIFIRTKKGLALLDNDQINLSYSTTQMVNGGKVTGTTTSGRQFDITADLKGGKIGGLLQVRNKDLPELASALAELTVGAADTLNAAHNNASTFPAPNVLEGRNTGLLGTDLISGTGKSYIALTDAKGNLVQSVEVEFSGNTITVNGNATTTIAGLVTQLNAAFGGNATASFTNGVLSIDANNASHGVATIQDESQPSDLGGRGFAHFFGLNDLVRAPQSFTYETTVTPNSPHGLASGSLDFTVYTGEGKTTASVSVNVAGTSVQDQLDALNNTTTGIGAYGTFSLDADGQIQFTPSAGFEDYRVILKEDSTERGSTGQSFSEVFGLGEEIKINRMDALNVRRDIQDDHMLLAGASLAVTATSAVGDNVLASGDREGFDKLLESFNTTRNFDSAGGLVAASTSLKDYAGRVASDIGSRSARASREAETAQTLKDTADKARSGVEGVNLDEELSKMSVFQKSYNAAARLMQAADEMFDTLLNII